MCKVHRDVTVETNFGSINRHNWIYVKDSNKVINFFRTVLNFGVFLVRWGFLCSLTQQPFLLGLQPF